ncbi:hypothetical protein [Roseateles sp.]|uniref:hypothetical protein n=1 Tax=Roseateles sp. TaxID=1971397 RepID=UPI0031D8CE75
MTELEPHEIEMVSGGDAAATRSPGTNSWGEIIDQREFDGAKCRAEGFFSWACFDFAMKYGNDF